MERSHASAQTMTARDTGLVGCRHCAEAWPIDQARCTRCGARLSSRDETSLQRVWAWWFAGVICYVPALTEPMLVTKSLFHDEASTIVGGAVELFELGSPGIAIIILVASIGIPVAKFMSIAFLAISVTNRSRSSPESRHLVYHVVEYIGRWSMIDVFVVAILSSLVQFSNVASVSPGPASLAFALSVVFTMFSAQSFDSRLIWDSFDGTERAH